MTPATATEWVVDRLSQAWRDGSAPHGDRDAATRGRPGDEAMRSRLARHPARPVGGGRLTLEQRLDSVWEGLRTVGAAVCPVCDGRMEGSGPARCGDCGSELF
jgi:hypothetical protein